MRLQRACAARVKWWVSVCPFVCYHVFCYYAQRDNKTAIPTGSSLHWLHFLKGHFRITTAFRSYCVKLSKWTKPICKFAQAFRRVRLLCVTWRHKKCIDSEWISHHEQEGNTRRCYTKSSIAPSLHLCVSILWMHEHTNKDVKMGLWLTFCLGVGIFFPPFFFSV